MVPSFAAILHPKKSRWFLPPMNSETVAGLFQKLYNNKTFGVLFSLPEIFTAIQNLNPSLKNYDTMEII